MATRQEQAAEKQARKTAKNALKQQRQEARREDRNWQKMVIRLKQLGAWIEGSEIETELTS